MLRESLRRQWSDTPPLKHAHKLPDRKRLSTMALTRRHVEIFHSVACVDDVGDIQLLYDARVFGVLCAAECVGELHARARSKRGQPSEEKPRPWVARQLQLHQK